MLKMPFCIEENAINFCGPAPDQQIHYTEWDMVLFTVCWGPPSLLSNGYQGLFPGGKAAGDVKLTAHLYLVPRSTNAWSDTSTPPIHLHAVVISWKKHRDNFTFAC